MRDSAYFTYETSGWKFIWHGSLIDMVELIAEGREPRDAFLVQPHPWISIVTANRSAIGLLSRMCAEYARQCDEWLQQYVANQLKEIEG